MTFVEHLFHSTYLKCELSYVMSYFFFIISMSFIILITTQTNLINIGSDTNVIRFIVIVIWFFISLFIGRVICYKKDEEDNNFLNYSSIA